MQKPKKSKILRRVVKWYKTQRVLIRQQEEMEQREEMRRAIERGEYTCLDD